MQKQTICLIFAAILASQLNAAEPACRGQIPLKNNKEKKMTEPRNRAKELGMEQMTFRASDGTDLNYCSKKTGDWNQSAPAALLVFLHGAGERGSDNQIQLVHAAEDLVRYCKKENIKALLVFPQCPSEKMWISAAWNLPAHTMTPAPTPELNRVFELMDSLVSKENCDRKRIYISGISMGGFGTWDAISRRPDFFAAAMPVCGGGDVRQAPKLVNLPLRIFHGGVDSVVMVKRSRDMAEAIRKAGGTLAQYTEYPGVDHNSWTQTYANEENLRWLFSQKKK